MQDPQTTPVSDFTCSWVGNTFPSSATAILPGLKALLRVPTLCDSFSVLPNGTAIIFSGYNEGGPAAVAFKYNGHTVDAVGGLANIGHSRYLATAAGHADGSFYATTEVDGLGFCYHIPVSGYLAGGEKYALYPCNWPNSPFAPYRSRDYIVTGLGVGGDTLWISDQTDYKDGASGRVWLFDHKSHKQITHFNIDSPLRIAALSDGQAAWIQCASGIVCIDTHGKVLNHLILPNNTSISSIAVQQGLPYTKALVVVAEKGKTPKIHFFNPVNSKNGISSSIWGRDILSPGPALRIQTTLRPYSTRIEKFRFNSYTGPLYNLSRTGYYCPTGYDTPIGVGFDAENNFYVLSDGAVFPQISRLSCYDVKSPNWSKQLWTIYGCAWADTYVPDPTDHNIILNSACALKMDWSKSSGEEQGSGPLYNTVDTRALPDDPRFNIGAQGGAAMSTMGVRQFHPKGPKFLYVRVSQDFSVFRMDAYGTVAQACSFYYARSVEIDKAVPGWPPNSPPKIDIGSGFWNDLNNNGEWEASEYSTRQGGLASFGNWGGGTHAQVDSSGTIWWGGIWTRGDRPPQSTFCCVPHFGPSGNPIYDWTGVKKLVVPELSKFKMTPSPVINHLTSPGIAYNVITPDGDLIIVGHRDGDQNYSISFWKEWALNPIDRPADWVARDVATWSRLETPFPPDSTLGVSSVTSCGDYVFLANVIKTGVCVYSKSNGSLVGQLLPPANLRITGTLDDAGAFCAWQLPDKSYCICVGDFLGNRNILYRMR